MLEQLHPFSQRLDGTAFGETIQDITGWRNCFEQSKPIPFGFEGDMGKAKKKTDKKIVPTDYNHSLPQFWFRKRCRAPRLCPESSLLLAAQNRSMSMVKPSWSDPESQSHALSQSPCRHRGSLDSGGGPCYSKRCCCTHRGDHGAATHLWSKRSHNS